jgi:putative spermidine/putrescine transport system ATP-binding protein
MFRPEDVALVQADQAHVEGTIVTALFLGNHTRLLVDVGTGQPMVVETAAAMHGGR